MLEERLILLQGLLLPFLGTVLGAGCVFVLRHELDGWMQKLFLGFASGVMVAASIWSLLLPAIELGGNGVSSLMPALVGFWGGTLFLLMLEHVIPHLHVHADKPEGMGAHLSRQLMLLLAVTLHNIPEGMAVGVVLAGWLEGSTGITLAGALTLSAGIAIQNFPEGAVISMPLRAAGMSRGKAFLAGALSGVVEPLGGLLMIAFAGVMEPLMPYLLAFAAGAMIYVVIEELIPEMSEGVHSNIGVVAFTFGFTLMMALDIVFAA